MIEHGGGQPAVQPALVAPMLGERLKPGRPQPSTAAIERHLHVGMEGAEQSYGLFAQTDDPCRPPAKRVAK